MKVNLTKLLSISTRVIYVNPPEPGSTGDSSAIKRDHTTGGDSPYSFEIDEKGGKG